MIEINSFIWQFSIYLNNILSLKATDIVKRSYLRYLFILLDNFSIWAPRLTNHLFTTGAITLKNKNELKILTNKIRADYETYYESIRNKLSAHHQNIDLLLLIDLWFNIDYTTISILIDDIDSFYREIANHCNIEHPDRTNDNIFINNPLLNGDKTEFYINPGRLGIATKNSGAMIPCHYTQEISSIAYSIADLIDMQLCLYYDNDKNSSYFLFVLKCLIVNDVISFIDILFNDSVYIKSLSTAWKENSNSGYIELEQTNRDVNFEDLLRNIRNKLCSHIDDSSDIYDNIEILENIEIRNIANYASFLINLYNKACAREIRSCGFIFNRTPLKGVLGIHQPEYKNFDDTNDA